VGGRGIEGRCWAGVWYAVAMQGNECSIGEDSLCNYVFLVLEEFLNLFRKSEGKRQDTKHEVIESKVN
jgi:hypothetical protein